MKAIAKGHLARAMSMFLVVMFMFTLVPASLIMAAESSFISVDEPQFTFFYEASFRHGYAF